MFLIFLSFAYSELPWWLDNDGSGAGIAGEDIGMKGVTYNGTGIVINVFGDGANYFHESYHANAIKEEFLEMRNNVESLMPTDPEVNVLGTRALSLALGKYNDDYKTGGAAPGANASSYDSLGVSLEYSLCHHNSKWDIGLILIQSTVCEGKICKYMPVDTMPKAYIDECFYSVSDNELENQRLFVVPSGEKTTDIFFSPPGRWPLVFTVAPVNNRGEPIGDSAEGAALFASCPSVAESKSKRTFPSMRTALPITNTSYSNDSFYDSYGAASIFAGGLAVILERRPNLTVTDLFYLIALTATQIEPDSLLWKKNAYGIIHSRKAGFGRLDIKGALDAIDYLEGKGFKSLGNFHQYETKNYKINLDLSEEDGTTKKTIPINITDVDDPRVMAISICLYTKNLGFGSLSLNLVSPNTGNEYPLKILTEWSHLNNHINYMEFPSYQFLGEKTNGNWIIKFPKIDSAARGLIVSIVAKVYFSNGALDNKIIDLFKKKGNNPIIINSPNNGAFSFKDKKVTLNAGKPINIPVIVSDDKYRYCPITVYLYDKDNKHRVKTKGKYIKSPGMDEISLDYVPSVYANGTKMNFVIESKSNETCYFQASIPVDYINDFTEPIAYLPDFPDGIIFKNTSEIKVNWNLSMSNVLDDGYSTSACLSIISPESKRVLRRTFTRNTGSAIFNLYENSELPSNTNFILEISPSADVHKSEFPNINLFISVKSESGSLDKYNSPFNTLRITGIFIIFGLNLSFIGYSIYRIYQKKRARDKENNDPLIEQSENSIL